MKFCALTHNITFKTLKYFQGLWSFERSISKPALLVKGTATFTELSKDTLSYYECGTYTVNETPYEFFQKRIFSWDETVLHIYKSDHSLLHKFEIDRQQTLHPVTMTHDHVCGQDTYSCAIILKEELKFELNYKISGENKDYEIRTIFKKD
jgi:hypothetical protein